eukprot:16194161-Heterocapsa_arctica.AAC.1
MQGPPIPLVTCPVYSLFKFGLGILVLQCTIILRAWRELHHYIVIGFKAVESAALASAAATGAAVST